jgi:quinolinate synthase
MLINAGYEQRMATEMIWSLPDNNRSWIPDEFLGKWVECSISLGKIYAVLTSFGMCSMHKEPIITEYIGRNTIRKG